MKHNKLGWGSFALIIVMICVAMLVTFGCAPPVPMMNTQEESAVSVEDLLANLDFPRGQSDQELVPRSGDNKTGWFTLLYRGTDGLSRRYQGGFRRLYHFEYN